VIDKEYYEFEVVEGFHGCDFNAGKTFEVFSEKS